VLIDLYEDIRQLKNPAFRRYAEIYHKIYRSYISQIESNGLTLDENREPERQEKLTRLRDKGVKFRNDDKSLVINRFSPACEACQTGVGSFTYFISLKCHRHCYYCFNPNQENYDYYRAHKRDVIAELNEAYKKGTRLRYLALTGGEPLLYREDTVEFFKFARQKFPQAHTRLYTSGDLLTTATLHELQQAGLDEIRFSIKLEDPPEKQAHILTLMAESKAYIPQVVVEMPVIPGTLDAMKDLLLKLDAMGIFGINLLEFCFPWANAGVFREKGFKIKNPPHQVLYNYWYAGGLPVAGSELEILDLLEFALDRRLSIGIHYCSLENKHTGQIYQQNNGHHVAPWLYFSPKDYFFKSAKVFGEDIPQVEKVLKKKKITEYQVNPDYNYLEFSVRHIKLLKNLDVEIGVSYYVMEQRADGRYLRELKIDLTTPQTFTMSDV